METLDPVEKVLDGWVDDAEAKYHIMDAVEAVLTPIQNTLGELNYCVIKYVENNPDAIKGELQEAIAVAKEQVAMLPYKVRSSSAVMLLATAKWLEMKEIFNKSDIQDMLHWLQTEMFNRTTLSNAISIEIGRLLSDEICAGRLKIGKASSPPFWKQGMAFISNDGAINITRPLFFEKILIPQNSKRFSDSEESTNPAVTVAERES